MPRHGPRRVVQGPTSTARRFRAQGLVVFFKRNFKDLVILTAVILRVISSGAGFMYVSPVIRPIELVVKARGTRAGILTVPNKILSWEGFSKST